METLCKIVITLDRLLLNVLKGITIVAFLLLTLLISASVFVRFVPVASMHWFDEIIELLYAYLVFFGAAALWINKEHLKIGDWVSGRLIRGRTLKRLYRLLLEGAALAFALVFMAYSVKLTRMALDVTNVFAIPKKVLYACMPLAGVIMVVYAVRNCAAAVVDLTKPDGKTETAA